MKADLLIHSAAVFDGNHLDSTATCIAVRDGLIAAVGTDSDVRSVVDGARDVVDAGGALVTPAFIDSHVHPVLGGFERLRCDVTSATNADEALQIIGDYARSHPEAEWIIGGGWRIQYFDGEPPTAELLDRVVAGRPAYLVDADHHGAWVSTEALRIAGITQKTPDPDNGRIDRYGVGEPSGTVQESAMNLFAEVVPRPRAQDLVDALVEAQDYLASMGITGWQDAIIGAYAGFGDNTDAYLMALEQGVLAARVTGALWLERGITSDDAREVTALMVENRARLGDAGLRATSIKIMQDGVVETRTAAMKSPYDDGCGHRGASHFDPQVLSAVIPRLVAAGFQIHAHAIGDRSLAEILDALYVARKAGDTGRMHHHIAHLQIVDPVDIPRMVDLGVSANIQALWACSSDDMRGLVLRVLGDERYQAQFPFGDLVRAGVPLAMGSDWPVSTPDPWQAIHVAVTRQRPGDVDTQPLATTQALSLETALAAYTSGAARVSHLQNCGQIAVGMNADLAVTDVNPFDVATSEIHNVANVLTLLAGTSVYASP
ncbi:amidohydrolase [Rhodococcus opacus]|uniref:amidohydrolase n=1 Tax=Rhodococcus opacus TaxID=37919 RepID=UPI002474A771|nr:amidohydrolase [Rhodococcus opacus]MDH6291955.1 putative amidohydrolase YtcJ [Rhodococcus opacus]